MRASRLWLCLLAPLAQFAIGCLPWRTQSSSIIDSALVDRVAIDPAEPCSHDYRLGVPDVISVRFSRLPQADCLAALDLDGTIDLGRVGRPRIEGSTIDEARLAIAMVAGQSPKDVVVSLVEGRSRRVFVAGPRYGRVRALDYTGPETLPAFLERRGLSDPLQVDLHDVVLLRTNVARGQPAEIHRVSLAERPPVEASRIVVQAGDSIRIRERPSSWWARHRPRWLLSLAQWFAGSSPEWP